MHHHLLHQFCHFALLFILLPLSCPQIVSPRSSKNYAPHWRGKLAEWPTNQLKVNAKKYGAEELKDWYCVTGKTKLKLANGKIKIDADASVVIETFGWDKQPQLLMLHFLVDKGISEFHEVRTINRAKGIDESCFLDDHPDQFGANQEFLKLVPFCFRRFMKLSDDMIRGQFPCKSGNQTMEFWQPKEIDESIAASEKKGILAIGHVLPFPLEEKCKRKVNMASLAFGWDIQDSEYKLLVHKNDVESDVADTLEDCLNNPTEENPTTTTTTITTTTIPTTTTTMAPTTTTKKGPRTKWTFAPNKIVGFLDRITPFPPGYKVKLD